MLSGLYEKLAAFDDTLPLERARTIPSLWYFDADIARLERLGVFGDTWQLRRPQRTGVRAGEVFNSRHCRRTGARVRDEHGTLRAFHNVCRHKAAQVINQPEGKVSKLRCRYHGWTYDLAGHFARTPEFDGVADFSKERFGLAPCTWMCGGRWCSCIRVSRNSRCPSS